MGENVYSYHGVFKLYFDIKACMLVDVEVATN